MRTFFLEVAASLDHHIANLDIDDFAVDNHDDQSITDLARAVLERLGWLTPTALPPGSGPTI
jgi:hypothetical protein